MSKDQIWLPARYLLGQTSKTVMNKISLLQRKAVRIITYSKTREHTSPLYKEVKILKEMDNISLIVHDYFNRKLPLSFNTLSTEPILKSSKSAFEKKGNDELRGGVWAQPKRHQTCPLGPILLKI